MSSTPLIVNFPELFPALAKGPLPQGVLCLGEALARGETPECGAFLDSLPIPRKEARLRVEAMREAAGNLWGAACIKTLEAHEQKRQDEAWEDRQEDLALQTFMASQEPSLATAPLQADQATPRHDPLLTRQLLLFIALAMEEDTLEHRAALEKLFSAEGLLRQAISGGADQSPKDTAAVVDTDDLAELLDEQGELDFHDEDPAHVMRGNTAFTFARDEFSLPETASATVMAEALLALLPQDACLFSSNGATCARIEDLAPDEATEAHLPEGAEEGNDEAHQMKTGLIPGWKLAGYTSPPENAPWLCRVVRLYWAG